mgnify:CR=1 FL=1
MELKILNLKNSYDLIKEKLAQRGRIRSIEVIDKVTKIVNDVHKYGDSAIIEYTREFDNVELRQGYLKVNTREIESAYQLVSKEFISSIRVAKSNIEKFHSLQLRTLWFTETTPGVHVGQKYSPLRSVGIYVPGGRASYPSTVLMAAIPAKIAGVEEIVICSPPTVDGNIDPSVIVAANEVGVNKIFKIGGAQAIAAMAYGTESVPKVEKIIGPGNIYVITAKLVVSNEVRIDSPAGPSEILILADSGSNPKFIAYDLMAQAEHDPNAYCVLVSESAPLLRKVIDELSTLLPSSKRSGIIEKSLSSNGLFIETKSLKEAIDFINDFAPEHLELMVREPFKLLSEIKNSGAIFLGEFSPVAIGDFVAGSNHILPTSGYAKTYSGLSLTDFTKSIDVVYATREGLKKIRKPLAELAINEKLLEHKNSVEVRLVDEDESDDQRRT